MDLTAKVICPYCGEVTVISIRQRRGGDVFSCLNPKCYAEFAVSYRVIITYTISKLDFEAESVDNG